MHRAGVEGGAPPDGAHTWVESTYAMLKPCRIDLKLGINDSRVNGTWQRPWADECKVGCTVKADMAGVMAILNAMYKGPQVKACQLWTRFVHCYPHMFSILILPDRMLESV